MKYFCDKGLEEILWDMGPTMFPGLFPSWEKAWNVVTFVPGMQKLA